MFLFKCFKRCLPLGMGLAAVVSINLLASPGAQAATTTAVAQHSGKCLDVRGGPTATADGARIEQWSCSGLSNQAWTVKDMGGGRYEFIASSSGKCVEVQNGGTANGSAIQQATCTGSPRQLWTLKSSGSGVYQVLSVPSGRCLDVIGGTGATADGVYTELWDCTGQANQAWALVPPAAASTVQITAQHSGQCLDVRGGVAATQNGALIEQWPCTGQDNQKWTLRPTNATLYEFVASSSGRCMEVQNGGTANGSAIQQSDCNGSTRQLWQVKPLGGGQNQIVAAGSGRCLDVTGGPGATAQGTLTELWDCSGQANQSWSFSTPGSDPGPPATTVTVAYHGDSTIWGYRSGSGGQVATPAPAAFAQSLAASGWKVDVRNEGVSGSTACSLLNGTDGVHPAWSSYIASSPAQVVILNHAINDEWSYDIGTYQGCLRQLAQIAKSHGKRVIFETPNPTRDSGPDGLDQYVNAMKQVAAEESVQVIDQYTYLTNYLNGQSVTQICPDGIHPSDSVYLMKGQYAARRFKAM